jgi:hypothetical protein
MTTRQLVSSLFLLSLAVTGLLSVVWPAARVAFVGVVGTYAAAVLVCSARAALRHGARCGLALAAVFGVLHGSYGLGFLRGIGAHLLGWRRPPAAGFSLSR